MTLRSRRAVVPPALVLVLVLVTTACVSESGDGGSVTVDAQAAGAAGTTTAPISNDATGDATDDSTTDPELPEPAGACDTAAARDEDHEVVLWHTVAADTQPVLAELLREFEEQVPEIRVRTEYIGGYQTLQEAFIAASASELPDLFVGQADAVRALSDSGRFVPPRSCTGGQRPEVLEDLLPIVEATYSVDGVLQAVPFMVSTPLLFFDRVRFRAAGLDPDRPPSTVDELRRAAEQLVSSGATADGLLLYDRSASWVVEQWAAREGRVIVEPDNGHGRVDGLRASFTDPATVASVQWLADLHADGLTRWIGLNLSGTDDLFAMVDPQQPGGMTLHTSAAIGDVWNLLNDPDTPLPGIELGVGPLPGPRHGGLVGGGGLWIVDRGDPAQAGAAWLVAEWLAGPPRQAALSAASGTVPISAAAAAEPVLQARWAEAPVFEVPYRQLAEAHDDVGHAGMQVGPRIDLQELLMDAARVAVLDGVDPLIALTEAEAAANLLLDLYASSQRD